MITDSLIRKVEDFVYAEVAKYDVPAREQINFSKEKGQWLAEKLKANRKIVLLGTLLMDCMLGRAYKRGKLKDHIEMSAGRAEELILNDRDLTKEECKNIIRCIEQHHGAGEFYSLEAEICCNADCYRFSSVEGIIIAIKYTRDISLSDLVALSLNKADEKWNALSLTICKEELEPQYKAIKEFLKSYKEKEGK